MFGFGKTKDGKPTLPTVRFDASRVTHAVRADLRERINEFEDLPYGEEQTIYDAALAAVTKGGALDILASTLTGMGVPSGRAAEIARYLCFRASEIMNVERSVALGLTEAKWSYSGAPCYSTNTPTPAQCRQDATHKAANGRRYPIPTGMLIDGRRTHPGMEPGCKCVSVAVIPGFDD